MGSLAGSSAGLPRAGNAPNRGADVSVRPATAEDAGLIARLQLASWGRLAEHLSPDAALPAPALEEITASWHQAVTAAPDRHHHVLVAVAGPTMVGFAALVPTVERPLNADVADPSADTASAHGNARMEIIGLEVDPRRTGEGHGSRLLAACADIASEAGAEMLQIWTAREDEARTRFLSSAGFGPTGLRRMLQGADGGSPIEEICWYTALGS